MNCRDDEGEDQNDHHGLQRNSHSYCIQSLGILLLSTSSCCVRDVGPGALHVLTNTIYDFMNNLDWRYLARLDPFPTLVTPPIRLKMSNVTEAEPMCKISLEFAILHYDICSPQVLLSH